MDNLAHTLVGAALAEAGLKKRTRLGMATLLIGANLPDIDALIYVLGESHDALAHRRGWTHGVLAMVVLPLVLTVLVVAWDRWRRRGHRPLARLPAAPAQVLLLSVFGVLSHPLLDWLNTYGVRCLMPVSGQWFYGDALFIVDPWLWLTLGLGVWLARRRERTFQRHQHRPARVALACATLYVLLMTGSGAAAEGIAAREFTMRGQTRPDRVLASPVPLNPFRRRLVYDTGEAYRLGEFSWTPRPSVSVSSRPIPKNERHPAAALAREHEAAKDFLTWSRFPFYRIVERNGSIVVYIGDARYASEGDDGWATLTVPLDEEEE